MRLPKMSGRGEPPSENKDKTAATTTTLDAPMTTPYQSYQDPLDPASSQHGGSQSTATTVQVAPNTIYRGFSTSIADSFVTEESERVDCCAITCCGIFQADRDRYILTGTKPPTCRKRLWVHLGLPVIIFLVAGYCAFNIPYAYYNQLVCTFLIASLFAYGVMQCYKGKWKRIQVRKELLWRLHQMRVSQPNSEAQQVPDLDDDDHQHAPLATAYLNGQSSRDLHCAHGILGCYSSDVPTLEDNNKHNPPRNLCIRMWQFFQKACCGKLCGCHFQMCGMCALAQEARELETLLPASRRRLDYITMQPMMEYYPDILRVRQERYGSLLAHFKTLSQLSKMLLVYLGGAVGIALLVSLLPMLPKFQFYNFLVFLATFGQAFCVLYIVHWYWHRFDLSLDAVIKYFASGFFLSVSLAVTWEVMGALLIRLIVEAFMAMSGIDAAAENEYGGGGFARRDGNIRLLSASVHDYMIELGRDHFFVYAILLCFKAYILAAMVEELCKYFGYRMVDHPDFMSVRDLQKAADAPVLQATAPPEEEKSGDIPVAVGNVVTEDVPDFSAQQRTHRSHAAAITVAMVTVATGFACCENLVYIFLYNGISLDMEIYVLINRSLLPVHPIAAALMSVGVVRRHVEKEKGWELGRIILPAVIFHGTFDYVLLLLDFWSTIGGEDAGDDAKGKMAASLSLAFAAFCVMAGFTVYFKASIAQRRRLMVLDNVGNGEDVNDDFQKSGQERLVDDANDGDKTSVV